MYPFYEQRTAVSGRGVCPVPRIRITARLPELQVRALLATIPLTGDLQAAIAAAAGEQPADDREAKRQRLEDAKRRVNNLNRRGHLTDEAWERDLTEIEHELSGLYLEPVPAVEDVAAKGGALLRTLVDDWEEGDPRTLRAILRELLATVEFDMLARRVVHLEPHVAWVPLFRLAGGLVETESGRFAPRPDVALPWWPAQLGRAAAGD